MIWGSDVAGHPNKKLVSTSLSKNSLIKKRYVFQKFIAVTSSAGRKQAVRTWERDHLKTRFGATELVLFLSSKRNERRRLCPVKTVIQLNFGYKLIFFYKQTKSLLLGNCLFCCSLSSWVTLLWFRTEWRHLPSVKHAFLVVEFVSSENPPFCVPLGKCSFVFAI